MINHSTILLNSPDMGERGSRHLISLAFFFGVGFFLTLLLGYSLPSLAGEMAQARVTLQGHVFNVAVAEDYALKRKGLGGRKHLGPGDGMLFIYAEKKTHTFWMKGMVIPIDIIWLDNRKVVHIEHRVPPPAPGTPERKLATYSPAVPGNIVLEIAAGRAGEIGIKVGDIASFKFY